MGRDNARRMRSLLASKLLAAFALTALPSSLAFGQSVTLPPSGDNQKAATSQWIGLVKVSVKYSSPDITGPNGQDRRGKIWGKLVPYGFSNLGFGTCGDVCPWRAGANENTVFAVSHDVKIEGKRLKAGKYGLHMVPGEKTWTIIFSNNTSSWGSYFYDKKEDVLRVQVKPRKTAYAHWLTYDFVDRGKDKATLAMRWDELEVPFTIKVDNLEELYVNRMRDELRSTAGFSYQGYLGAARYCFQNNINLKEGLAWAEQAATAPFVGQKNFQTLSMLAALQAANGAQAKSKKTLTEALAHSSATPLVVHQFGRQLLGQKKKKQALQVFKANAEKHKDAWPVHVGLARGYSAVGELKKALKHAEKAVKQAPDKLNRDNLKKMVVDLKAGKPVS